MSRASKRHKRHPGAKARPFTGLDPDYIHKAHTTSLTCTWGPDGPIGPTIAAACSGRIGWDYKRSTHPYVELYRGQDETEAERLVSEHNERFHETKSGVSETGN